MRRFQFSFADALKAREGQLLKLQKELDDQEKLWGAQQARLRALKAESARALDKINRSHRGQMGLGQLLYYEPYLVALKKRLEAQAERVEEEAEQVAAKQRELIAMQIKKRSLEQLREQHFEEHRRLMKRGEMATTDEIATLRFGAARQGVAVS